MADLELAAAHAQRTLTPGSGKCVLCAADIWRYLTSGDTNHLTMFDEVSGGSFDFPDAEGDHASVATRPGIGRGNLHPHNCLQDAS
jgi:hypothetical protein